MLCNFYSIAVVIILQLCFSLLAKEPLHKLFWNFVIKSYVWCTSKCYSTKFKYKFCTYRRSLYFFWFMNQTTYLNFMQAVSQNVYLQKYIKLIFYISWNNFYFSLSNRYDYKKKYKIHIHVKSLHQWIFFPDVYHRKSLWTAHAKSYTSRSF